MSKQLSADTYDMNVAKDSDHFSKALGIHER